MLFYLVIVAWIASEIILAAMRHGGASGTRRDRGSLALVWVALTGGTMAAVFLQRIDAARIAGAWAYWAGLALIVIGIVFRWTAIFTLRGVAALGYRIAVEERALIDHFGERYRDYAR